jgi:hypothetical protein
VNKSKRIEGNYTECSSDSHCHVCFYPDFFRFRS